VAAESLNEAGVREALDAYLSMLQTHPTADEMIGVVLTEDFETGFAGGHLWRGREGLADFLSQREGFFDERHELKEVIEWHQTSGGEPRPRPAWSSSYAAGSHQRRRARSTRATHSTAGDFVANAAAGLSPLRSSRASRTSTTTPGRCSPPRTRV
jgi:hypothetical protein